MPKTRVFDEPFLDLHAQMDLLRTHCLCIPDPDKAAHYLQYIGYYRLSGYLQSFQQPDGNYVKGTSFDQVLDLYVFDRKLRLLTFDAIERIEVALRSSITSVMGGMRGPQWFSDATCFEREAQFQAVLNAIRKETINKPSAKRDLPIRHYYETYHTPDFPPSWMVFETLSMGTVSLTYKFLTLPYRKQIARHFAVDEKVLSSWIHAFVYTRNLCAHHARLWDRVFTLKPIALKRCKEAMLPTDRFSAQAVAIQILLDTIAPGHHWERDLKHLYHHHPQVDKTQMGFLPDWQGFVTNTSVS